MDPAGADPWPPIPVTVPLTGTTPGVAVSVTGATTVTPEEVTTAWTVVVCQPGSVKVIR